MHEDDLDPPRVHYSFKPTEHRRVTESDKQEHPEAIEVKKILRDNLAAEAALRANNPTPEVWKSRRTRDYLLLITIPNGLIALAIFLLPKNAIVQLFGLSLMVFYSLGISWLVWVVMDRD